MDSIEYIDTLFNSKTFSNNIKGYYYLRLLMKKNYYLTNYIERKYKREIIIYLKNKIEEYQKIKEKNNYYNLYEEKIIKTKYRQLKTNILYKEMFDIATVLLIPIIASKL